MADSDIEQGLESVAQAATDVAAAAQAAAADASTESTGGMESGPGQKKQLGRNLEFILDVALQVTVEVGRTRMTIQDLLRLGQGSVVELEKLAGEPLDIYINGKQVARGEAVIVNDKFGVRLTDIVSPEDRIEGLEG
ncbi:MAG: flagellar motor switch protein FliN [Pseudomonadota bacterium]|jgi:flagellar motor switch protein FliN/FliY